MQAVYFQENAAPSYAIDAENFHSPPPEHIIRSNQTANKRYQPPLPRDSRNAHSEAAGAAAVASTPSTIAGHAAWPTAIVNIRVKEEKQTSPTQNRVCTREGQTTGGVENADEEEAATAAAAAAASTSDECLRVVPSNDMMNEEQPNELAEKHLALMLK